MHAYYYIHIFYAIVGFFNYSPRSGGEVVRGGNRGGEDRSHLIDLVPPFFTISAPLMPPLIPYLGYQIQIFRTFRSGLPGSKSWFLKLQYYIIEKLSAVLFYTWRS